MPKFKLSKKAKMTWLHDGEEPVVCFDPERVAFGHGRLRPGGHEMFPRPGMHWAWGGMFWPFWGYQLRNQRRILSFRALASKQKASFRLVTRAKGHVLESDWRMDITYDAELRSYVYDVTTTATVIRKARPEQYNPYEFEYFDLFVAGMLDNKTAPQLYRDGRHHPLPGPLWGYFVYDKQGDGYGSNCYRIKAPLNRWITEAQNNVHIARDGIAGFMNNPIGNPVVQLVGDTAAVSSLSLCNWFYDLHFTHVLCGVKEPPPKGFSTTVRFRIMEYDCERSHSFLESAELPAYLASEYRAKSFVRYEESGVNSFENAVTIDAPDHGRIWRPFHDHPLYVNFGITDVSFHAEGKARELFDGVTTNPNAACSWDRQCGRTGTSSLKVATTRQATAGWSLPLFEAPQLEPDRRYRLSVWIRTRGLTGKGATLAYFQDAYQSPWLLKEKDKKMERRPVFASKRVKGNSAWKKVEVITPPLELVHKGKTFEYDLCICALQPVLWHEGAGESWFDDFLLEPVE